MKKHFRWVAAVLAAMLMFTGCAANGGSGTDTPSKNEHNNGSLPIAETSVEFAAAMKLGWNLGNTLDANGSKDMNSETSWGQPMVTKELIEFVKATGYTTIRIPVSWANHTDADYKIDEQWMNRVNEVVDYALDAGLYVILNSHHDNNLYYPSNENYTKAVTYLTTIWTQIADHFKDYDERLIFEGMNEPRLSGTNIEWWFNSGDAKGCAAIQTISMLDQAFVDTIRDGEGYNKTRYLMVSSYAASPDFTMHKDFTIPTDPSNRIMISVHAYTPYDFAMNANGYSDWSDSRNGELTFIDRLKSTFIDKGYGVVIGEFGATNKGNDAARVAWAKAYTGKAAKNGIPCVLWDNGGTQVGEENFGMINRRQLSIYFPEVQAAYLEAYK